jgi:hypothetical protein
LLYWGNINFKEVRSLKNKKNQIIKDNHDIKTYDSFSWGGDTVKWEEKSEDIAIKLESYKRQKKYKLK